MNKKEILKLKMYYLKLFIQYKKLIEKNDYIFKLKNEEEKEKVYKKYVFYNNLLKTR